MDKLFQNEEEGLINLDEILCSFEIGEEPEKLKRL